MNFKKLAVFAFIFAMFMTAPAMAGVNWKSYDSALSKAKNEGKLIYLYFYTDWCKYCKKMDKETLSDPKVAKYLNRTFIPVRINPDKNKKNKEIASKFGVRGFPANGFAKDGTRPLTILPGYIPPEKLLDVLKYLGSGSYEKMPFTDFLKKQK